MEKGLDRFRKLAIFIYYGKVEEGCDYIKEESVRVAPMLVVRLPNSNPKDFKPVRLCACNGSYLFPISFGGIIPEISERSPLAKGLGHKQFRRQQRECSKLKRDIIPGCSNKIKLRGEKRSNRIGIKRIRQMLPSANDNVLGFPC